MSKTHGGKGDSPRPVNGDRYRDNHERIFGKRYPRRGQIGKIDRETGLRCIGEGCYEHVNTEESHLNER